MFVVATANDISKLPPELLRKGRFDEIFYVGLPTVMERREIFRIHLERRKRSFTDTQIGGLAEATKGFTGAEIEQAVIEGEVELTEVAYGRKRMLLCYISDGTGRGDQETRRLGQGARTFSVQGTGGRGRASCRS